MLSRCCGREVWVVTGTGPPQRRAWRVRIMLRGSSAYHDILDADGATFADALRRLPRARARARFVRLMLDTDWTMGRIAATCSVSGQRVNEVWRRAVRNS